MAEKNKLHQLKEDLNKKASELNNKQESLQTFNLNNQKEKEEKRLQRQKEKDERPPPAGDEDPDIAGVVPGPQPLPEEML